MPAPSHEGSVVLDIGEDTGALVIHTGPEQDGQEIEVSPVGEPDRRTHAAVRPRHLPGRTVYSVVITPLPAGEYTVWRDRDTAEAVVSVHGGGVSEYHWT
ncbi:phospholipase [Streptacidiphilus sp. PB12-B1b]|nr:phospholipase [Streptacidiphilus sp. PB12-B1b]